MTGSPRSRKIKLAFETTSLRIPLGDIEMLRAMTPAIKKSVKYAQIEASIREVGIIEPPVVVRIKGKDDRYRLLDGHIRIEILKERGDKDVVCLVATDDEGQIAVNPAFRRGKRPPHIRKIDVFAARGFF